MFLLQINNTHVLNYVGVFALYNFSLAIYCGGCEYHKAHIFFNVQPFRLQACK